MRLRSILAWLLCTASLALTGCTVPGLPPSVGSSSCGGGADRCAALNCPPGTHCMLTSSCAALCDQEQLSSH